MTKIRKYNIFILITTISKSMIEIFIPIILFNKGLNIKEIITFYMIKYILLIIFTNLMNYFKVKNKILIYMSSAASVITYILLYTYHESYIHLLSIAVFYALYLCTYWLYRHNIALNIIENKKATDRSSLFMIITLIGIIPSSLLGGYLISRFNIIYLIILITILTIFSLFYIVEIKSDKDTKNPKIYVPFRNKLFLAFEQFKFITFTIFPLFTYNEILKSFTYIGFLNTVTAVSSIIYIFFLARLMDKKQKDYLSFMCILLGVTWLLKLNLFNVYIFMILTIFEGVSKYGLDTIVLRNIYCYGRDYEALKYNTYIENIRNFSRVIISFFLIIFNTTINAIIIIGAVSLFVSAFIKLDAGKYGYKKSN